MTTADDLLRRALDALSGDWPSLVDGTRKDIAAYLDAPKDEPVAWKLIFRDRHTEITSRPVAEWKKAMWESAGKRWETYPLYLHPPTKTAPKTPMTEEEIEILVPYLKDTIPEYQDGFIEGIDFAERHHGIGGGDE